MQHSTYQLRCAIRSPIIIHRHQYRCATKLKESKISPFATTLGTSLGQYLGHKGDGIAVDQILNGEYVLGDDIMQPPDSQEL